MRKSWLLVPALVGASLVPVAGPASGSCAGPSLSSSPLTVGSSAVVRGGPFVDGCNDTGGGDALGCTHEEPEPVRPLRDLELVLRQGGRSWTLGTADASSKPLGRVRWEVVVPSSVSPGPATLVVGDTRLPVRVLG